MKVIIQNAEGNQIASLEIGAEYGYEQFIVANSLEGCFIVNKWYSEEDRNGDEEFHFADDEVILQLG